MRVYDPRVGRFLSIDPLTSDFPELTPFQFASNRPIDGVDLDGAEYSPAQLNNILAQAKAVLGKMLEENGIVLRGAANAMLNANSLGVTDAIGSRGTDNLDSYSTQYEQKLYLWGRVVGNVASILLGSTEGSAGAMTVAAGGVATATVAGAVVGVPAAVGGLIAVAHGTGVVATGAIDLGESIADLGKLGVTVNATGNSQGTASSQETAATNKQATSAHGGNTSSARTNAASNGRAGKTIGKSNGVTVKSYGTNDVHKPAHAHVLGGGPETRIGMNGKPLKGQPSLTTQQSKAVRQLKAAIRTELRKVGKENQRLERQQSQQ